jgi:UbiD family decarboxylase
LGIQGSLKKYYELFPQFFPLARGVVLRAMDNARAVKQAARIVAVSACTRRDLLAFGADACKITVVPEGVDELLFAGLLRRAPVEIVKCRTIDLEVPANSEIVLEGYVDPQEKRLEGPFGDHTGYYSQEGEFPVFHVTCMTRRKDAIYPATIVGKPPMEDCFMGKASERLFLPFIKRYFPKSETYPFPLRGSSTT